MKKQKHSRPSMKQSQHPAHNMPAEEHNGTPMGTNPMMQPDSSNMPLQAIMQAAQSQGMDD